MQSINRTDFNVPYYVLPQQAPRRAIRRGEAGYSLSILAIPGKRYFVPGGITMVDGFLPTSQRTVLLCGNPHEFDGKTWIRPDAGQTIEYYDRGQRHTYQMPINIELTWASSGNAHSAAQWVYRNIDEADQFIEV